MLARLETTEPNKLWEYLQMCLDNHEAICGEMWNPSRRQEFFRIMAKAVRFDPDSPPPSIYDTPNHS